MLCYHEYYLEFTKLRPKIVPFSDRKSIQLPQKYLKIPENLTYQAASGNAQPKSVLNATRVIKVTQTTKKYGRDTIIENQPSFRRNSNFSDISMAHRWAVHGKAFFRIQTLPMDGPWVDHAWPCIGVHRWPIDGPSMEKLFSDPNFTHGWPMGGPCMAMHWSPWDLSTGPFFLLINNT